MKVYCKETYYHSIKFEKGEWYSIDKNEVKGTYFVRTSKHCGSLFIDDDYEGERKFFKCKEFSKYFYTLKELRKEKLKELRKSSLIYSVE